MSGDTHKHYDSYGAGPEWGTPRRIWKPLADAVGGFDLDPASGAETEPIADTRYTVDDNGLVKDWFGDVWINPPYGRTLNDVWASKIVDEWESGNVDTITALVPASTDTQYFHNHYATGDYFTFIENRIYFEGDMDDRASFPSLIVTWGNMPTAYIEVLHEHGFVTQSV